MFDELFESIVHAKLKLSARFRLKVFVHNSVNPLPNRVNLGSFESPKYLVSNEPSFMRFSQGLTEVGVMPKIFNLGSSV